MTAARPLLRAGFDEAGLGPTLGPLVVAGFATARTGGPTGRDPIDDLSDVLAAVVGPPGRRGAGDHRLEVGDSKKIHTGTRKLARLERTALATVAWVHGRVPSTVAELFEAVVDTSAEVAGDRVAPWWRDLDETLPVACDRQAVAAMGDALATVAASVGVRPRWYRADVLSAARVNRELDDEHGRGGTKNTWATHTVLRHAARMVAAFDDREVSIWCDKAGGRQAYAGPLRRAFPAVEGDGALEVFSEHRPRSQYAMAVTDKRIDLGFVMGGDRLDPRISWASILAKYCRELIMRGLNRYFAANVPTLRATAGYPEDARRFIAEVEAVLGEGAGIGRRAWVRSK